MGSINMTCTTQGCEQFRSYTNYEEAKQALSELEARAEQARRLARRAEQLGHMDASGSSSARREDLLREARRIRDEVLPGLAVQAIDATAFREHLRELRACRDATIWADGKSLAEAIETCERADWLLWLAARAGVD